MVVAAAAAAPVAAAVVETEVKFVGGDEDLRQAHSLQMNVQKKRPLTPTTLPQKICCLTAKIPIAPPSLIIGHLNQLTWDQQAPPPTAPHPLPYLGRLHQYSMARFPRLLLTK